MVVFYMGSTAILALAAQVEMCSAGTLSPLAKNTYRIADTAIPFHSNLTRRLSYLSTSVTSANSFNTLAIASRHG